MRVTAYLLQSEKNAEYLLTAKQSSLFGCSVFDFIVLIQDFSLSYFFEMLAIG